jgi:hypothetical protein
VLQAESLILCWLSNFLTDETWPKTNNIQEHYHRMNFHDKIKTQQGSYHHWETSSKPPKSYKIHLDWSPEQSKNHSLLKCSNFTGIEWTLIRVLYAINIFLYRGIYFIHSFSIIIILNWCWRSILKCSLWEISMQRVPMLEKQEIFSKISYIQLLIRIGSG